jgi:hypothetical protein
MLNNRARASGRGRNQSGRNQTSAPAGVSNAAFKKATEDELRKQLNVYAKCGANMVRRTVVLGGADMVEFHVPSEGWVGVLRMEAIRLSHDKLEKLQQMESRKVPRLGEEFRSRSIESLTDEQRKVLALSNKEYNLFIFRPQQVGATISQSEEMETQTASQAPAKAAPKGSSDPRISPIRERSKDDGSSSSLLDPRAKEWLSRKPAPPREGSAPKGAPAPSGAGPSTSEVEGLFSIGGESVDDESTA